MIIISDFSDTIATTSNNSKFPPFELELGKILGIDNQQSYEEFLKVRRDNSIPYNERMKIWLKPFTSQLEMNHITTLVSTFKLNQNFINAVKLIKKKLKKDSLEIKVASGTLWQIIDSFLTREDIFNQMKNENITFDIKAAKLIFDIQGKFSGDLEVTDSLAYSTAEQYPLNCLVLGDNTMENYGFGNKLLNVQNYNEEEIVSKIDYSLMIS